MTLYTKLTQPLLDLGSDKYLHFIVCLLMTFFLTALLGNGVLAFSLTMFLAAIVKEVIIDYILRCTLCDWQDILADIAGAMTGMLMTIV